jgi:hypothetical protein
MPPSILSLLLAAAPPLLEHPFRLEREAEAVAVVWASCERCDWSVKGREAAVIALALDGRPSQHLVLSRGGRTENRLLLGSLAAGEHRLALALDARLSAPGAGAVRVEAVDVLAVAPGDPRYEALAHAPIVHTRPGALARFSDVPLVAWVEADVLPNAGRALRYSIVFSHEDGGTPIDRLMATWGRATDVELVYAVELDAASTVRRAEFQGKDHVTTPFAGRREGLHPVLHVVTKNNMVADRGKATPRVALAPVPISLEGVSREAVMDAHPWTYAVSAAEIRREGLVRDAARLGSKRIPDPRRFAFVEACGAVSDARLAVDLGVAGASGALVWRASDAGRAAFRIARSGCFRAGVALGRGESATDVRALRLRAHTRPPREGEPPLPRGTGSARVERVNRLYGLGLDDRPGPHLFRWSAGAELVPDGPPLELPVR